MCLKFDPEENTLKQTCSGKCKNRCGFKLDENEHPSSAKAKKVRINVGDQASAQLQDTPFRLQRISMNRKINLSNSINTI